MWGGYAKGEGKKYEMKYVLWRKAEGVNLKCGGGGGGGGSWGDEDIPGMLGEIYTSILNMKKWKDILLWYTV